MAAAFTVGLDQQVRCWRVHLSAHLQQPQQGPRQQELSSDGLEAAQGAPGSLLGAACYLADGGGSGGGGNGSSSCSSLRVAEAGCCFTQVVEPAALDVLVAPPVEAHSGGDSGGSSASRQYLLGVAGRGTEVLTWSLPPP